MTLSPVLCLKFEINKLAKFRADVRFSHNFMIRLRISKRISLPLLRSYAKGLEREEPKLSYIDFCNLSKKFLPNSWRAHFTKKKVTERYSFKVLRQANRTVRLSLTFLIGKVGGLQGRASAGPARCRTGGDSRAAGGSPTIRVSEPSQSGGGGGRKSMIRVSGTSQVGPGGLGSRRRNSPGSLPRPPNGPNPANGRVCRQACLPEIPACI